MTRRTVTLTVAFVLAATTSAAWSQEALTEREVRAQLTEQGYTQINDVEFSDGIWKADARSADGNRTELSIDPKTGQVHPGRQTARLSEPDVRARLTSAGYTGIHDVEFDHGIWTAEADDSAGKSVKISIDPTTGKVMGREKD